MDRPLVQRPVYGVLALLLLAGCMTTTVQEGPKPLRKDVTIAGYKLGSIERHDTVKTLHIPRVNIQYSDAWSREPHLQMEVTDLIINEFTKEQTFEVVPRAEEADATLQVTLRNIKQSAIQYTDRKEDRRAAGVAQAWLMQVYADVKLIDNRTGEVLFADPNMHGSYDFMPTADFMEARREALHQAYADLAKEIRDNVTEPW